MNKRNIIALSGFYIFVIILAIVFFFYDLPISQHMVKESPNFFYVLVEAVGEFPIYLGPILFGLVFGFTSNVKIKKMLFHFIGLIATYIGFIRLSGGIFECYLNSQMGLTQYILLAIASLLAYLLLFILFEKIKVEELDKIKDIALIMLVVSLSSFALVTSLKYIWGRPRYRSLSSDYSQYVNFLTIDGFRNGFPSDDLRSFPSGHTNAATSIIIFGLLPSRLSDKKWIKYVINIFCFSYPICVAICRIGIGAHYASDVLFGFVISFTCYLVTYIIFKKKGWLHVRSNKC